MSSILRTSRSFQSLLYRKNHGIYLISKPLVVSSICRGMSRRSNAIIPSSSDFIGTKDQKHQTSSDQSKESSNGIFGSFSNIRRWFTIISGVLVLASIGYQMSDSDKRSTNMIEVVSLEDQIIDYSTDMMKVVGGPKESMLYRSKMTQLKNSKRRSGGITYVEELSEEQILKIIDINHKYIDTIKELNCRRSHLCNTFMNLRSFEAANPNSEAANPNSVPEDLKIRNAELQDISQSITQLDIKYFEDVLAILSSSQQIQYIKHLQNTFTTSSIPHAPHSNENTWYASWFPWLFSRKSIQESSLSSKAFNPIFGQGKMNTTIFSDRLPRLFVLTFLGDMRASQLESLREEVNAVLVSASASHGDKVLIRLESSGGAVSGYGLSAAQLQRIRDQDIELICCVDQVAASGGYMMACVANKIIAAPFSVLGSIGVISWVPNVYERLQREGVSVEEITAGKYKSTVSPFKKPTMQDQWKVENEMKSIHEAFKCHIRQFRPMMNVDKLATGETWIGSAGLALGLCDEVKTSDEAIFDFRVKGFDVFFLKLKKRPNKLNFSEKLIMNANSILKEYVFNQLFPFDNYTAPSLSTDFMKAGEQMTLAYDPSTQQRYFK